MTLRRHIASVFRSTPWLIFLARRLWRFGQARFTIGVVGVVINGQQDILLVEHVYHPVNPWGLPGGWTNRNENPEKTVQRELQEELELAVTVGPLLLAQVKYGNHLDMAYLCYPTGTIGELSAELLDYRWFKPDALPRLHGFHHDAIQAALALKKQAGAS
jgi:8-oxo-dGTP diphosphatase